jgi:hypothetical protein
MDAWSRLMNSPTDVALHSDYANPVRQLLTMGETRDYDPAKWPNYVARFGFGDEHVGELIRLACDPAMHTDDSTATEVWAPMHAWRALGQLRAEASIVPLLALLKTLEDDEAADAELPVVFAMIGPVAIPFLVGFLADPANPSLATSTAILGIKEIALRHPACRDECVGILVRILEATNHTNTWTGGCVVCALMDLTAVETIDAIRDAFRRDAVDSSLPGDLEDVEIEFGLRERRATPRPHYMMLPEDWARLPKEDRFQPHIDVLPKREKVGRNDPCPCGSGKKYKKCCL